MHPDRLADLYDVAPLAVRLQGGPHDGRRVAIDDQDWPLRWLMPIPSDPAAMYASPHVDAPDVDLSGPPRMAIYDYTDSLNEQGERIYQYKRDM